MCRAWFESHGTWDKLATVLRAVSLLPFPFLAINQFDPCSSWIRWTCSSQLFFGDAKDLTGYNSESTVNPWSVIRLRSVVFKFGIVWANVVLENWLSDRFLRLAMYSPIGSVEPPKMLPLHVLVFKNITFQERDLTTWLLSSCKTNIGIGRTINPPGVLTYDSNEYGALEGIKWGSLRRSDRAVRSNPVVRDM